MARRPRRNHSAAFKAKVALAALKSGGALLLHLISKLHEKTSVIITTSLDFGEWVSVFGDRR